jgi:hypothetical protein
MPTLNYNPAAVSLALDKAGTEWQVFIENEKWQDWMIHM